MLSTGDVAHRTRCRLPPQDLDPDLREDGEPEQGDIGDGSGRYGGSQGRSGKVAIFTKNAAEHEVPKSWIVS